MAMVPAVIVFGVMVWFATRKEGEESSSNGDQNPRPQGDQRGAKYVKVYSIDGFNYCVYRISQPDGEPFAEYEGQDKLFFIAEKTDPPGYRSDPDNAMTNILETSAGPATYQTLQQAKSALDSLHEGMSQARPGSQVVYESTSTDEVTSTQIRTTAETPEGTIEAEGIEEGATMDELDIELYDGDGSLVETYNVQGQAGTVQTQTDLGGYI